MTVGTAARQDVPVEVRAIGHVEPYSTVSLKARVGGEVTQVGFQEGQDVKKGELLFQIDPRPYEAALAQARAQLERDRARREERRGRFQAVRRPRQEGLRDAGAVRRDAANAAAGDRDREADEAAVENARLQLSYCTITAPISARAGSILVHPGNHGEGNDDSRSSS